METKSTNSTLDKQGRLLFIVTVVVAYAITFAFRKIVPGWQISGKDLTLGLLTGVFYLLLGLFDQLIFSRFPPGWGNFLFFSIQSTLVFAHGWFLGIGGNFLMAVPLIGFAVERLNPWPRLLVYAGLITAVVIPLGMKYEPWESALISGATVSVVFVFIALFAQLRVSERQARERAEALTAALEISNTRLAAYATQAEELAMTQERNRLAREIHDNLGHYLTVVNVQIEAAKVVMESDPVRALDALDKAQERVQKGLSRVRESVAALRESPVGNRPLGEAIAALVEETQSAGIVTELVISGKPGPLENKVALALYRAAQEGLTNVRRHARASRVDVQLDFQPDEIQLNVKDHGIGAEKTSGGFGLLGIRERMQLLGGKLEISTGVGQGFCLTARVPLSTQPAQ